MNLNNQSKFDAVIDDYTRGPDPEEKLVIHGLIVK